MSMHLEQLGTPLLRTFSTVAELGSVTRASVELGRTQPAVSLQLKKLEEVTGTKLFQWKGRAFTLTRDGDLVLAYAHRVMAMTRELGRQLAGADVAGTVVIGIPELYAQNFLSSVLEQFARSHPTVKIELRCQASKDLLPVLLRGKLDIALLTRRPDVRGGRLVRQEPLVWAARARLRLPPDDVLHVAMFPKGYHVRELTEAALKAARRPYSVVAISESITGLYAALTAGLAVAPIPRCAVISGLVELSDPNLPPLPSIDITAHLSARAPRAAGILHEFLCRRLGN